MDDDVCLHGNGAPTVAPGEQGDAIHFGLVILAVSRPPAIGDCLAVDGTKLATAGNRQIHDRLSCHRCKSALLLSNLRPIHVVGQSVKRSSNTSAANHSSRAGKEHGSRF